MSQRPFDDDAATTRATAVLSLLAGERSVAELAQELEVSPDELLAWKALYLAGARSTLTSASPTTGRRGGADRRSAWAMAAGCLVAALAGGVSYAQSTSCSQTLPSPLITLCANAPALASDLNGNSQTLYGWINQKVGTPGSPNVAVSGTTTLAGATTINNSLTVTGATTLSSANASNVAVSGALSFGSTTRQMMSLFQPDYGIGVQPSTLYVRTGGAVNFYRGGLHADTAGSPGTNGVSLAGLDSSGHWSTTGDVRAGGSVKSRGTSVVKDVTACCSGSSGNCCPGGYSHVNVDLNRGAGGDFCYVCFSRAD